MERIINILKEEIIRQALKDNLPLDLNSLDLEGVSEKIGDTLDDICMISTLITLNYFHMFQAYAKRSGDGFIRTLELIKDTVVKVAGQLHDLDNAGNRPEGSGEYNIDGKLCCWDDAALFLAIKELKSKG